MVLAPLSILLTCSLCSSLPTQPFIASVLMLLSVAYWWYEPFPYPSLPNALSWSHHNFCLPIPFRHKVSGCSVSCSSLASRLCAKPAAANFRGNLIPFLRVPTFAGYNYLLPSSLGPLCCWLPWRRHTGTHVYKYQSPASLASACAAIVSPALDACWHCPLAQLFQLLRALPHFPPVCQVLFPVLPLPIKRVRKGSFVCVCIVFLGWLGLAFAILKCPQWLSPLDTFVPWCGDAISVACPAPCQCPALTQLLWFAVPLGSPCLDLLV